jgi:hypothetical protein
MPMWGHACIVYKQPTGTTYATPTALLSATTTFDAWGAVTPEADQVAEKNAATYWNSANCDLTTRSKLWFNAGLTATEVSTILTYSKQQDPDKYDMTASLTDETLWYCSKLVYRAYLKAGKDIKNGASSFVTPNDIALDADMNGQCF